MVYLCQGHCFSVLEQHVSRVIVALLTLIAVSSPDGYESR